MGSVCTQVSSGIGDAAFRHAVEDAGLHPASDSEVAWIAQRLCLAVHRPTSVFVRSAGRDRQVVAIHRVQRGIAIVAGIPDGAPTVPWYAIGTEDALRRRLAELVDG